MNLGYFCYMAEAEGHDEMISTRAAKVNAIIKDLRTNYYDINEDDIMECAKEHNLADIDYEEFVKIFNEVHG